MTCDAGSILTVNIAEEQAPAVLVGSGKSTCGCFVADRAVEAFDRFQSSDCFFISDNTVGFGADENMVLPAFSVCGKAEKHTERQQTE